MTTYVVTASGMKTHLLLGLDPMCYRLNNVFSGQLPKKHIFRQYHLTKNFVIFIITKCRNFSACKRNVPANSEDYLCN